MPPNSSSSADAQRALAAACRTGAATPIAGARADRIEVYRGLVRNGIEETLRRAYPILHSDLAPAGEWAALVDRFIAERALPSPELWKMPRELLAFLEEYDYGALLDRPYLDDLARFEWLEIEVHLMPDDREAGLSFGTLPAEGVELVLNRESLVEPFEYPVFKAAPKELAPLRGSYFLLIFRHPETLDVRFAEVPALAVMAIEALRREPLDLRSLQSTLAAECAEAGVTAEQCITTQLIEILGTLAWCGMIGHRSPREAPHGEGK